MGTDLPSPTDKGRLEAFLLENPELAELERLIGGFNLFEALRVENAEIRHSNFLAFLLDPSRNHGLSDLPLRRFLQAALRAGPDSALRPIDIELLDLASTQIRREWRNIDILILDEQHGFACIVENKIWSSERPGQLRKYFAAVRETYPAITNVFGVLLTPDGDDAEYVEPSMACWPMGYGEVERLLSEILQTQSLSPDVTLVLRHYRDLLRVRIMENPEVVELCRRIYARHRDAIDLIVEHAYEGGTDDLVGVCSALLSGSPELIFDSKSSTVLRFVPKEWDAVPLLRTSSGWHGTDRLLRFEIKVRRRGVILRLTIGPGPEENRRKLLEFAKDCPPLRAYHRELNEKWNMVYKRELAQRADLESENFDKLDAKIRKNWQQFVATELPTIRTEVLRRLS